MDRIRQEAKRIQEQSLWAAERHYAAETPWYIWNYLLGIPTTILAAVAGAAAFSKVNNSEFVAGCISILVAILTSLITLLDPHKKASIHHNSAKAYETLYHNSDFFYRIESLNEMVDLQELEKKLHDLNSKLNELNQSSPAIPGRAYRIAEQNIKAGKGEVIRVPEE